MERNCGSSCRSSASTSTSSARCWSSLSFIFLAVSSLPLSESFQGSPVVNSGHFMRAHPVQSYTGSKIRTSANCPVRTTSKIGVTRVRLTRSSSSSSTALTTSFTEAGLAEPYDPNCIEPKTKSITGSMVFFARFVVKALITNQLKKKRTKMTRRKGTRRKNFLENLAQLNEQRKNLVALAGYNAPIVIPSFAFLLLGAVTTSIVPLYESKCIQLVATLHPTRSKVIEALIGLVVSSTLASLFTGLRGSLFWLAGTFL